MSVTLTISEEKFSKDELGRHVTTLTQMARIYISCEIAEEVSKIITEYDKKGEVEYYDVEVDNYEVWGKCVNSILELLKADDSVEVKVIGTIDENQLYEVTMDY